MMACTYGRGHYANDTSIGRPGVYPFQETGPKTTLEVKSVKEGLFGRVDMPGVGDYEVEVFVKDNTVFFKGEARNEYTDNPRTYLGSFNLSSHSDKIGEIRTEMKNGVLRILAPAVFTKLLPVQSSEGTTMSGKKNPFQCKGTTWAFEEFVTDEEKLFARIDMPGVEKETVKVWVSKLSSRSVIFKGKAPKLWEYEKGGDRSYGGLLTLKCGCCRFVDVDKFTVENGVLQILVSKMKIIN